MVWTTLVCPGVGPFFFQQSIVDNALVFPREISTYFPSTGLRVFHPGFPQASPMFSRLQKDGVLEVLDVLYDAAVLAHLVLNHLERVEDRGVVSPTEFGADGRGGHLAEVVGEVDRHVARKGDVGRAALAHELLMAHVVELLHHALNRVDVNDLVRGVEVDLGHAVDVLGGELGTCGLTLRGEVGAALAEALQRADVVARDLGHVAQVLVGELALGGGQGLEQRCVHVHGGEVLVLLDDALVVALEDDVLHLKARLGHQAEHAAAEAAGEALVHGKVLGRAVGCQGDFLAFADEAVHELEEELDGCLLAHDVLDVVDDEDVRIAVFAHDEVAGAALGAKLVHVIVEVGLGIRVFHADVGLFLGQVVADGKEQVRLAQARVAVDEQARALLRLLRVGGETHGAVEGVAVLVARDKARERVLGVDVQGRAAGFWGRGGRCCCGGVGRRSLLRRGDVLALAGGVLAAHLVHHLAERFGRDGVAHRDAGLGDGLGLGGGGDRGLAGCDGFRRRDRACGGFGKARRHLGGSLRQAIARRRQRRGRRRHRRRRCGRRRGRLRLARRSALGYHYVEDHGHERDLLEITFDELALFDEVVIGKSAGDLDGQGFVVKSRCPALLEHVDKARFAAIAAAKRYDVVQEDARFVIHVSRFLLVSRLLAVESCGVHWALLRPRALLYPGLTHVGEHILLTGLMHEARARQRIELA